MGGYIGPSVTTQINASPTDISDKDNASTGAFDLPSGTTAQRPASPNTGYTRYNTTIGAVETWNGTAWVTSGGLVLQAAQTANFTAVAGNSYPINTTSGAVTATLPASPTAGQQVNFFDYAGTAATNAISISPNGLNINGGTSSAVVSVARASVTLVYVDASQGWVDASIGNSVYLLTVPGSPTSVSATAVSYSSASVAFTAPVNNGGSTILSYTAVSSPGGITGTVSQSGSGTISVTGLSATTTYTFTVYATNALGSSVVSSPSSSITTPAAVIPVAYAIVGGGGGGGGGGVGGVAGQSGGGGGSGGYASGTQNAAFASTYTITVGAGGGYGGPACGCDGDGSSGSSGSSSSAFGFTATGGAYGYGSGNGSGGAGGSPNGINGGNGSYSSRGTCTAETPRTGGAGGNSPYTNSGGGAGGGGGCSVQGGAGSQRGAGGGGGQGGKCCGGGVGDGCCGGYGGAGANGVVVLSYPSNYPDAVTVTGSPTYSNSGGTKTYTFTGTGSIRW